MALGAVLVALGGLAIVALRDNPARPAVGERRQVRSDDAEIHYFASGPVTLPAVALVASFGRSASDFNELVPRLNAAGYRTLAVQLRGIDGSTLPSVDATLHTYAADLRAVVDTESPDEAVVVIGHAYGNRVVRTFASDFPERARAVVLLAAGGEVPTPPEATAAIARAIFPLLPDSDRREAIELAFFAEGNEVPDDWMRGWYAKAALVQSKATDATPYEEWGSGGGAPILVLEPGEDAVALGAGERLRRRYPERVQLQIIAGAGHALLPEQPEVVSRAILAYLDGL